MPGQIGRRRDQQALQLTQPFRHHAGRMQFAEAQRHVDAFADDVGAAIVQQQLDGEIRMTFLERDGQRGDMPLSESGRRMQAQIALQLVVLAVQRLFRFVDRRHNRFEALIVIIAGLRQGDRTRAAKQQLRPNCCSRPAIC